MPVEQVKEERTAKYLGYDYKDVKSISHLPTCDELIEG